MRAYVKAAINASVDRLVTTKSSNTWTIDFVFLSGSTITAKQFLKDVFTKTVNDSVSLGSFGYTEISSRLTFEVSMPDSNTVRITVTRTSGGTIPYPYNVGNMPLFE